MIRIRVIKEVTVLFLLKMLFDISYILYVNKYFEYMGFTLDFNLSKWLLTNVIVVILFLMLKNNEKNFSVIYLKTLLVVMIIPTLSIYALKDLSSLYMIIFVLCFAITILISKLRNLELPKINVNKNFLYLIFSFLIILVFINLFIYNGLPSLTAFNLIDVYDVRSNVVYGGNLMGYLRPWVTKVIIPFIIAITFYKKSYLIATLFYCLQILIFLYTGHKSYLFSPILIISLMHFVKKKNIFINFLVAVFMVVLLSLILSITNINSLFASLFIRRTFFITAQNYFYYYDFFSRNDFVKLSHSILDNIFTYPYLMPPPNIIGQVYYHNAESWVNTGYLSDAFMNFGFWGMLLFSVLLGLLLLLIDSIKTALPLKIAALFIPMFSLRSSALFTSLLTGGILLGIIILYFYSIIQSDEGELLNENYSSNHSS